MSLTVSVNDTLEYMSGRAGDFLDAETDESHENAVAILDEWSYGDLDDCRVLLTDYLNDNLQSVHEELLYVTFCDTTMTEGTIGFN
jgi:hypothetical protein